MIIRALLEAAILVASAYFFPDKLVVESPRDLVLATAIIIATALVAYIVLTIPVIIVASILNYIGNYALAIALAIIILVVLIMLAMSAFMVGLWLAQRFVSGFRVNGGIETYLLVSIAMALCQIRTGLKLDK